MDRYFGYAGVAMALRHARAAYTMPSVLDLSKTADVRPLVYGAREAWLGLRTRLASWHSLLAEIFRQTDVWHFAPANEGKSPSISPSKQA